MNQEWVSGFTDAEGCFSLSYRRDRERYAPMFVLKQHTVDNNLLCDIRNFLGVGRIYTSASLSSLYVKSEPELRRVIPSFHNHLRTSKIDAYNRLCAYFALPKGEVKETLSEDWLSGFIDGEGSFYIIINKHQGYRYGYQIRVGFGISQNAREVKLLGRINRDYLQSVARLKPQKATNSYLLSVDNMSSIRDVVIPLIERIKLKSRKWNDFLFFKQAVDLMSSDQHLQPDSVEAFENLRRCMYLNRTGKRHDEDIVHA
jgi:hypothetical protein